MTNKKLRKVPFLFFLLALVALGGPFGVESCGKETTTASMTLSSNDVTSGGTIDSRHAHTTCNGQNLSPQLSWSGEPSDAASFAITILDLSFNNSVHWIVYNIPLATKQLARDATIPTGSTEVTNVFNESGYGGPCPNSGDTHTYEFKVWALKVDSLSMVSGIDLNSNSSILNALDQQKSAVGTFQASFTGP